MNKDSALIEVVLENAAPSDIVHLRSILEKSGSAGKHMRDKSTSTSVKLPEAGSATGTDPQIVSDNSPANSNGNKTVFQKETAMRANDIRSCGKNGDLKGAIKVFERLGAQAENTLILNSILDACVECKDIKTGLNYFNKPELHAVTDVVSFNTMMKGYIASGQEQEAKRLLEELAQNGLGATRTSFHGLLNARVNAGDFNAAWKLVTEMQANDISPNAVTCSILMKGKMTSTSDLSRVLALIDTMEQPMDDVLFPAVVEACIRTGRLDLLSRQTEKFMKQGGSASVSAPTYGSMIKAYGQARDVKRVWHLWDQMLFHSVQPTPLLSRQ